MSGKTIADDELLADLERVNDEVGGTATTDEYDERGEYHSGTFYERFGSWPEAQRAAGGDVEGRRRQLVITDDELLADLERVNGVLGAAARMEQYRRKGDHAPETFIRRFGSWADAQAELGNDISGRNGVRR